MNNWEEVVNSLPDYFYNLFYKEWNKEFKKCTKCEKYYPKHKLFFRYKKQSIDNLNPSCKGCDGQKFINKYLIKAFDNQVPSGYKYCNKCGNVLPATNKYFTLLEKSKDGLASNCKKCRGFKEFGGKHPAVILKNLGEAVIVAPLSSGKLTNPRSYEVEIDNVYHLPKRDRYTNITRITPISIYRIDFFSPIGSIHSSKMREILTAMKSEWQL